MRFPIRLLPLAAVLLSFFSSVAFGTTIGDLYRFSYAFRDQNWEGDGFEDIAYVTGTVNGTRVGDALVDLSNPTLFVNGFSSGSTMFIKGHQDDLFFSRTPPVMSFDGYYNNFVILDADLPPTTYPSMVSDFYFLGIHGNISASGSETAVYAPSLGLNRFESYPASWKLELVSPHGAPTKIPDGSSTIVLLGLAGFGVEWFRRKLQST